MYTFNNTLKKHSYYSEMKSVSAIKPFPFVKFDNYLNRSFKYTITLLEQNIFVKAREKLEAKLCFH